MADDTQNLNVTISAQDAGATTTLQQVRASIVAIQQELGTLSASGATAGAGIAAGAEKASAGLGAVNVVGAQTNETLRSLEGQTGTIARGFEALGIGAGESAARVEALVGALDGMESAVPGLLAIGAALTALFSIFEFFKTGVKDAEDFQSEMSSMASVVEAQGGNWAALSANINDFVASESIASGFTKNELAASLNSLVTSLAGVEGATAALSDSEKIEAVAEEIAIAKHLSLADATHMITEAEVGRGTALAQLDPRIKTLIEDHAHLSDALNILHGDYAKELDDTQSAEMAQARLHAAYAGVGQEVGSDLLPIIVKLSTVLLGSIPVVEGLGKALADGLGGAFHLVVDGAMAAVHGLSAVNDATTGHFKDALTEASKAQQSFVAAGKGGYNATVGWIGDVSHAVGEMGSSYTRAEAEIQAAIKKHIDLLGEQIHLQQNPVLGMKTPSGGGGFTPPVIQDAVDQTKLETAAEQENQAVTDALANAKDHASIVEAQLAANVKAATSVTAEQAAQAALDAQKITDLAQQHTILNAAVYQETQALKTATGAQAEAKVQYDATLAVVNQWTAAHAGAKNMSESEKETYDQLKSALEAAKQAYGDASSAVKALTDQIRQHKEEMAQDAAAQLELANAAAYAAAEATRKWNEFYDKDQAAMKEDADTFGMTNQQKVAYYATMVEQTNTLTEQSEQLKESYYTKELDAYKSMLQQEVDAQKAALDKEASYTQQILGDLLEDHKTFADAVKDVLQGMLKDYIDIMSKELTQTPGFQSIAQFFGGPNVSQALTQQTQQTQSTTKFAAATQQYQTSTTTFQQAVEQFAGAARSGSAGAPGTTMTPSGPALNTYTSGVDAQEVTTDFSAVSGDTTASSYTPVAPGSSVMLGWGPQSQSSIEQGLAAQSSDAGETPADTASANSTASKYGNALMEALMGYMIGQSVNQMENPNELPGQSSGTWAGAGGAIGDVLGSSLKLFGSATPLGPVGGFLGAILGSLIGGLFGSHETAAEEPDVSEPTYGTQWNYGQFVSNMIGTYGTYNGQYYGAQQPYNISEGGTSMASQVAAALKDLPTTLSPALESLSSQLKALEDGDQNPNALAIKSEYQGEFTLMSGATVGVQQYMQMINSFMNQTAGMVPTFELTRAYPNFNQSTLTATGEYLPTVNVGTGAQGIPPGTTQPIPGTPTVPSSEQSQQSMAQRPIYVTVKINGPVIGGGQIPQEVAQEIAQALQRLQIGTAAGGFGNRMGTGTGGGDF